MAFTSGRLIQATGDVNTRTISNEDALSLIGGIPLTQKAAPSGVATLDSEGKVPTSQLPPSELAEPPLGNPDVDGKVLISTTAGVRSWSNQINIYSNGIETGILINPNQIQAFDTNDGSNYSNTVNSRGFLLENNTTEISVLANPDDGIVLDDQANLTLAYLLPQHINFVDNVDVESFLTAEELSFIEYGYMSTFGRQGYNFEDDANLVRIGVDLDGELELIHNGAGESLSLTAFYGLNLNNGLGEVATYAPDGIEIGDGYTSTISSTVISTIDGNGYGILLDNSFYPTIQIVDGSYTMDTFVDYTRFEHDYSSNYAQYGLSGFDLQRVDYTSDICSLEAVAGSGFQLNIGDTNAGVRADAYEMKLGWWGQSGGIQAIWDIDVLLEVSDGDGNATTIEPDGIILEDSPLSNEVVLTAGELVFENAPLTPFSLEVSIARGYPAMFIYEYDYICALGSERLVFSDANNYVVATYDNYGVDVHDQYWTGWRTILNPGQCLEIREDGSNAKTTLGLNHALGEPGLVVQDNSGNSNLFYTGGVDLYNGSQYAALSPADGLDLNGVHVITPTAIGLFSATPVGQQEIAAAAVDPTSTQTLVNSIRSILLAYGWATPAS